VKRSIILEGMDGSGKSTLARALASKFETGMFSIGGPPSSDEIAMDMAVIQYEIMERHAIIFDRATPISRLCYEIRLPDLHHKELFDVMDSMLDHAIVIWCIGNSDDHEIKTYDTKEHIEHITKNHGLIKNRYASIMKEIPHITYDFNVDTLEDIFRSIV